MIDIYENLGTPYKTEKIAFYNCDCMELLRQTPDNYYDLCIVDPPYGIDAGNTFSGEERKSGKGASFKSEFTKKDWDKNVPTQGYFKELFRVSKNCIVWGANYMTEYLPSSMGWIVWDKDNGTTKFSDCELAFSSFDRALRKFVFTWNGMFACTLGCLLTTQKQVIRFSTLMLVLHRL